MMEAKSVNLGIILEQILSLQNKINIRHGDDARQSKRCYIWQFFNLIYFTQTI